MAMEIINLGNIANDGTGDDLRVAFEKVNANFDTLNEAYNTILSAENIGDEGEGVFKDRVDTKLQFKKIAGGDLIVVIDEGDILRVDVDFEGKDVSGIENLDVTGNISAGLYFLGNLRGNVTGNLIGTVYPTETNPVVAYGNVVGKNGLITNIGATNYAPATVDGIVIQDLYRNQNTFDFGGLGFSGAPTYSNPLAYLLGQIGIDMGVIDTSLPQNGDVPFNIDGGSFGY